jgi:hypothetical protein
VVNEEHPTLGEIGRSVDRLEKEIGGVRGDIRQLEEKVPTKELVQAMERAFQASLTSTELRWSAEIDGVKAQLNDLESWKTWTLRLVMGLVIAAVIGLVLVSGSK